MDHIIHYTQMVMEYNFQKNGLVDKKLVNNKQTGLLVAIDTADCGIGN